MLIAMVSNYPPMGRPVSEYCFYLVEALGNLDEINRITVLADSAAGEPASETFGKVTIRRCWDFDSYLTPWRLLKTIRSIKPDICWFNITLGSFGMSLTNFPALLTPIVLERVMRLPTLVTLHNIIDLTNVKEIGLRGGKLAILGTRIATWSLCQTSLVCVLLQEYEPILRRKYNAKNVQVVPLGILGQPINWGASQTKRLLCFGIFGTHKRLETTLEAMRSVYSEDPEIKLSIVGGSNSHSPDYLAKLQHQFGSLPNVDFLGYIPENQFAGVFRDCTAVLMPYMTIGGESATLGQTGMYGKPVLVSDLPLFRQKEQEGYALNFIDINNPGSIKAAILALFRQDPEGLAEQGRQNFRAATTHPMSEVVQIYAALIQNILNKRKGTKQ